MVGIAGGGTVPLAATGEVTKEVIVVAAGEVTKEIIVVVGGIAVGGTAGCAVGGTAVGLG